MDEPQESTLKKILTDNEYASIPEDTRNKVEKYILEEIEKYITAKAVYETGHVNTETKIQNLEEKIVELNNQHELDKKNIEALNENMSEMENQLSLYRSDISKLHEVCSKAEHETSEFRRQRDIAVDERDNLLKMIERRTSEVDRLQTDVTSLTEQLQSAINAKCEALAKMDGVESMKMSLEYKERRMEQERTLLNSQIQNLTEDLNKRVEEIMNMRRENTMKFIDLQTKLDKTTQELRVATETIQDLTDMNNELTKKSESLAEKLKDQHDVESKYIESFTQEIQAQTKLADLYKNMSDESKAHIEKLSSGISELQSLLNNAAEQYGQLETKFKEEQSSYEQILAKKNECIDVLKKELEDANDLLRNAKDQKLENVIENLAPSASATSRLIKSGMSMTQIYSQYVSVSDELIVKDGEIQRLNGYIETILQELEDKAPMLKKQREDYEIAVDNVNTLTKQNDSLIIECHQLREESAEVSRKANQYMRENERVRRELSDMSRQVCYLLKEVEELRSASVSSHENDLSTSDYHSSSDIISKRLVTFADIEELQSNNQKLLALVRELSSKQEEAETVDPTEAAELRSKIEMMQENQAELLDTQERQTKMLSSLIRQRDMYKKLYHDVMKNPEKQDAVMDVDDEFVESRKPSPVKEVSMPVNNKDIEELRNKLSDTEKQLNVAREEYANYLKERNINEKMINDTLDALRTENTELNRNNCKLVSTVEYNEVRFKNLKSNMDSYKKQINTLEKKCDIYNTTIVKHEQTIMHLKDETLNAQSKLSRAEVMMDNLRQENRLLKDTEVRLTRECDSYKRESHGQHLLLNNLESIKASLERSEAEGRIRLESRLDETNRECSALRRRLQEEQDRFRELSSHLERQAESAQKRLEEEKVQSEKLKQELDTMREELVTKSNNIEQLTRKLKLNIPSLDESANDKRIKELENQLNIAQQEVKTLSQQFKSAKEHAAQYCNVAENSEKELREFQEVHNKYKETTEEKLKLYEKTEQELKQKIGMLEEELNLESNEQNENSIDLKNQLIKVKNELNNCMEELTNTKSELETMKAEVKKYCESAQEAEEKYTREMLLHSNDIQILAKLKDELVKVNEERNEILRSKQAAIEALEMNKASWEKQEHAINSEKEEIKSRIEELDKQNAVLHNQIEALSTQLSIVHAQQGSGDPNDQSVGGDVSFNKSMTEDDVTSADQLLQIIKFLRREKDISVTKYEIVQAENSRLKSQQELLEKQFEEVKSTLSNARQKVDVEINTSAKHSELLRKVETLNAITDSNRVLREERDSLVNKIKNLTETVNRLEEELAPLQEKNRELASRADAVQAENVSLRADAIKWRQRANLLVEKSNKTSPDDWRRLQNERENLAKMLMTEKDNVKKSNEAKIRVEQQVSVLQRQHQLQLDQLKKQTEELNTVKQQLTKITQDCNESKALINKMKEESTQKDNEMTMKNTEFKQLQARYISVRNLARKLKATEATKAEKSLQEEQELIEKQEQFREEGRREVNERITALEKTHEEKLQELTSQVTSTQQEVVTLKKENEQLRSEAITKYERYQSVLRSSKTKLQNLYETNDSLNRELNEIRNNRTENQDDSDMRVANLKLQYESRISHLEKEKSDAAAERKQERERLAKEIESLNQRIALMQRQLSMQHGSKPSTSSVSAEKSSSDPPPTANIKPMAGHSPQAQQSVSVPPRRAGETPFASIRPMSMPARTITVFPQNMSSSGSSTAVLIPPQQQLVHTTGNSSIEALSSSPTSSHTDYMPATSSANPAVVVVPPTQQATITGHSGVGSAREENSLSAESTQQDMETTESESTVVGNAQQTVAMVLPRVGQPSGSGEAATQGQQASEAVAQQQEPSTQAVASSQPASSSSTVTTTQAGLKRPRDEAEGSASSAQDGPQSKGQPQLKRTRLSGLQLQRVTESGIEVEYQVPTSSQRDQEDDVIVVDSEEDDDEEEGPDEGVEVLEEPDDGPYEEGDNPEEGYEIENMVYDQEQELTSYDDPECQATDEEAPEIDNEVDIIEDSSTTPDAGPSNVATQSGTGSPGESSAQVQPGGSQSDAISSGNNENPSGVMLSQASPSITHPFAHRGRNVTPLNRQQHLVLPHSFDEATGAGGSGDDGIVPSTPTLYVPRRTDGFSEAVSSPQVPSGGRFTFNDSPSQCRDSNVQQSSETVDDLRITEHVEESGTGRSVPTTPLEVSPQGESTPTDGAEISASVDESIQDKNDIVIIEQSTTEQEQGTSEVIEGIIPEITLTVVSGASSDAEPVSQQQETPVDTALQESGPSSETNPESGTDNVIDLDEGTDGVSSEGEKPEAMDDSEIEEGREAEASTSPSSNIQRGRATGRRSARNSFRMSNRAHRPIPIIWNDPQNMGGSPSRMNRGQAIDVRGGFSRQRARRNMRRPPQNSFGRF